MQNNLQFFMVTVSKTLCFKNIVFKITSSVVISKPIHGESYIQSNAN